VVKRLNDFVALLPADHFSPHLHGATYRVPATD